MRVFDANDVEIPEDEVDLSVGYLELDYIEGDHIPPQPAVEEIGHTVYTVELEDGSTRDFDGAVPPEYASCPSVGTYVVDVPYQPAVGERVDYEPIYRFIKYSDSVAKHDDEKALKNDIKNLVISSEKMNESMDTVLSNLDDVLLAMADIIGGEEE